MLFDIHDETQQRKFGQRVAKCVDNKACVIFLQGDLGTGKTTFMRGFLKAYGYVDKVKSPTYTLIETYECPPMTIVHMDLYRLNHPSEMDNLNLRDYLNNHTIIVIEWPEKALAKLPQADLNVHFDFSDSGRKITLQSHSAVGHDILGTLQRI